MVLFSFNVDDFLLRVVANGASLHDQFDPKDIHLAEDWMVHSQRLNRYQEWVFGIIHLETILFRLKGFRIFQVISSKIFQQELLLGELLGLSQHWIVLGWGFTFKLLPIAENEAFHWGRKLSEHFTSILLLVPLTEVAPKTAFYFPLTQYIVLSVRIVPRICFWPYWVSIVLVDAWDRRKYTCGFVPGTDLELFVVELDEGELAVDEADVHVGDGAHGLVRLLELPLRPLQHLLPRLQILLQAVVVIRGDVPVLEGS